MVLRLVISEFFFNCYLRHTKVTYIFTHSRRSFTWSAWVIFLVFQLLIDNIWQKCFKAFWCLFNFHVNGQLSPVMNETILSLLSIMFFARQLKVMHEFFHHCQEMASVLLGKSLLLFLLMSSFGRLALLACAVENHGSVEENKKISPHKIQNYLRDQCHTLEYWTCYTLSFTACG